MGDTETKQRILDAAETLFARFGFSATSMREISAAAEVNLAAPHYYFHSKEALFERVLDRRLRSLNQERLRRLRECEQRFGDQPVPLEELLRVLIAPFLEFKEQMPPGRSALGQLIRRLYVERGDLGQKFLGNQRREIGKAFFDAFRRTLPDIAEERLMWRLYFVFGTALHVVGDTYGLEVISNGRFSSSDPQRCLDELISFLAAGLRSS